MSILATILNTLVVILAVLLIALILVQPTKSGGGFGSAFGGLGESVFGAQAMSHLSRLTVWCISIFFVLTLASAIVASHIRPSESNSVLDKNGAPKTSGAAPVADGDQGEKTVTPGTTQIKQPDAPDAAQVEQAVPQNTAQVEQAASQNAAQVEQAASQNTAQVEQAASQNAAQVEQAASQNAAQVEQVQEIQQ